MDNKTIYKVFLPNGRTKIFYFIGDILDEIFDTYGILHVKGKDYAKISKLRIEDLID